MNSTNDGEDEDGTLMLSEAPSGSVTPSPPRPFSVPSTLASRFQDAGEVARGGMGSIRKIYDQELLRHIALKVLDPMMSSNPDAVQRFNEEAQITGQLDHPNIVPVHNLGEDPDGAHFFMMKLVQGRTFFAELHKGPGLPFTDGRLDDLLAMFLKVCDAVAFAHSRGVIHRDIKPQNIMVGDFGQVYLMDWGVARVVVNTQRGPDRPSIEVRRNNDAPDLDQKSSVLGTPAYMAPEQALGFHDQIDERTDVFTLGAVLYEMLTLRPPHQGATMWGLIYSAATCNVIPPDELLPDVGLPRGLCKIAMRALSKDPNDRYPSAIELKHDIERYLRGQDRFPVKTFAPGERVITEGEPGETAFIIKSGRCAVFKTIDGKRVTLREMTAGDVFGEAAVFTAKPRTASVDAIDELTVLTVTRESLREQLGLNTYMGAFVKALAERFRELDERLGNTAVVRK